MSRLSVSMLQQELWSGVSLFCSTLIPLPNKRTPITPSVILLDWPLHFIPIVFLAFLARRPDTYLIRLLIFPLAALCSVHFGFGYQYMNPMLNVYNWGIALLSEYILARTILWTFTPEGMIKYTESAPNIPSKSESHAPPATHQGSDVVEVEFDLKRASSSHTHDTLSKALSDAFEVMTTLRGMDFRFSQGTYFPPPNRPLEPRSTFLKATLHSFLINFLILDVLESLLKFVPGVGDSSGGSIFVEGLEPVPRFILAILVHFITGSAILTGFGMVYDIVTIIAVGILQVDPRNYPPATERPFASQSLREFWGKRWHQFLRTTVIVLGGWPLSFILSSPLRLLSTIFPNNKTLKEYRESLNNLGLLFGTFIGSGLFHETSSYAMGHGIHLFSPTMIFFAAQGVLILLERVWSKITGRKVSGWLGMLWVWIVVVGGGQLMIDSWHMKSLGGGLVIFPWISPTRLILIPLLQRFAALLPVY